MAYLPIQEPCAPARLGSRNAGTLKPSQSAYTTVPRSLPTTVHSLTTPTSSVICHPSSVRRDIPYLHTYTHIQYILMHFLCLAAPPALLSPLLAFLFSGVWALVLRTCQDGAWSQATIYLLVPTVFLCQDANTTVSQRATSGCELHGGATCANGPGWSTLPARFPLSSPSIVYLLAALARGRRFCSAAIKP